MYCNNGFDQLYHKLKFFCIAVILEVDMIFSFKKKNFLQFLFIRKLVGRVYFKVR